MLGASSRPLILGLLAVAYGSNLLQCAKAKFPLGEAFCQDSISPFSANLSASNTSGDAASKRCWDISYTALSSDSCKGVCCNHDIASFVLQAHASCAASFGATAELLVGSRVVFTGRAVMLESPASIVIRDFRELSSGSATMCFSLDDASACDWPALLSSGVSGGPAGSSSDASGAGLPWKLALVDSTEQCCPVFAAPGAGGSLGGSSSSSSSSKSCKELGGHRLEWKLLSGLAGPAWSFFGEDTTGTRCRTAQEFAKDVLGSLGETLNEARINATIEAARMVCASDSTFEVCLSQTSGSDHLDMGQVATYLGQVHTRLGDSGIVGGVYGIYASCPLSLSGKGTPAVVLEDDNGATLYVARLPRACSLDKVKAAFPFCSCKTAPAGLIPFSADPFMVPLEDGDTYCLNLKVKPGDASEPCTQDLDKVEFLATSPEGRGSLRAVSILLNGTLHEMRPQLWRMHATVENNRAAVLPVLLEPAWTREFVEQNHPQLCLSFSEGRTPAVISKEELIYALHSGPSCCPTHSASY